MPRTSDSDYQEILNPSVSSAILAQQSKLKMLIEEAEQSNFVEWHNVEQELDKVFYE